MREDTNFEQAVRHYLVGFSLALFLTLVPFGLVAWGELSRPATLMFIGTFGLIQVIVHFRYFLHINFKEQKREDLLLILFSTVLLSIMAGGTIWIMANLAHRMHV
ncbi:MAG: cytochrome o ubiquinol oxidase subunit IV [Pseudomonadota bacterium]